jgi:hypothetical protein
MVGRCRRLGKGAGLVRAAPADGRNRLVALTARGWDAIAAGRAARAEVTADLRATLGEPAAADLLVALGRLAAQTGALSDLLARRLRPGR